MVIAQTFPHQTQIQCARVTLTPQIGSVSLHSSEWDLFPQLLIKNTKIRAGSVGLIGLEHQNEESQGRRVDRSDCESVEFRY